MTHDGLVKLAERWLRGAPKRCRVVLADVRVTCVNEQPDAIGWNGSGQSFLVECKASREDAVRDRYKSHRRVPSAGMGLRRYLLAPMGVVGEELLGEGWGMLEWDGERVRKVRESEVFEVRHVDAELRLLVSAVARVTEGWGRRMFGDVAPPLVDGDPPPSVAATMRALRRENELLKALARK